MEMKNKNYEIEEAMSRAELYYEFEEAVVKNFHNTVTPQTPLFTTGVNNLWELYIGNIQADRQHHYECNACRSFIQRYGNLVTITPKGQMKSVLWDIVAPPFFTKSVQAMKEAVEGAYVTGVFISDEQKLGLPRTGQWTHLHAKLPKEKVNKSRLYTAHQLMAEKREEFGMVNRALTDFTSDTVEKALQLLNTETLYRSDKCLGVATNFNKLQQSLKDVNNQKSKNNIVWLYVANAPVGHCRIKSSMIGTLLEDIQSGLSFNLVSIRFAEKMSPDNYMRSQSAPTVGNIQQAERMVAQLGIEDSLLRRYATIDEIEEFIWRTKKSKEVKPSGTGVFGGIQPKAKTSNNEEYNLPTTTMTWEKFNRTVLPTADSIEVKVDNSNRLMALVTAENSGAENILQWNNPFSWYYHGGIDAEMKKRVEEAGGRYEDNEIRCSLMWEGYTDLDLHCITPLGQHIMYNNKRGNCGGYLDLDMNGIDKSSDKPVENMRWKENAPEGHYKFYVRNFSQKGRGVDTSYKAELEINGQLFTFQGSPLRGGQDEVAFSFTYHNGEVNMISQNNGMQSSEKWNIASNSFVKVNGITMSPNTWADNNVIHAGTHVFFLLEGCQDSNSGKGRGFFVETLNSELYPVRKTLEAFISQTPINGLENATACGVGYNKDNEWNLTLKVTSNNASRLIKIDRWD